VSEFLAHLFAWSMIVLAYGAIFFNWFGLRGLT
jgi:ABC-type microcin C transport system permease subunit YejB